MSSAATFDPQRRLKPLCLLVLVFIPINMLFSPIFDFLTVEKRGHSWTVSMSTFILYALSISLLIAAALLLKTYRERLVFWGILAFFIYAVLWTVSSVNDADYPLVGLTTLLAAS